MAVCDTHVFPGFLTPVLTQLFFPKPPATFLTCICRGEREQYAVKKVLPQPSDTLTTEPPVWGCFRRKTDKICRLWLSSDKSHLPLMHKALATCLYKPHNDYSSTGCFCLFCLVEILNMLKTSHRTTQTATDIAGQGADSPDKKGT